MASTDDSRTDHDAWRIAGLVALAFLAAAYGLIALLAPDRAHGVDAAIGAGGLAAMAGALSYLLRSRQEREKRVLAIELAESRERLGAVLDNANLGIVVHVDGIVVLANPWAARLSGHPNVEAVLGRRAIDFIHPDSRPVALSRIAQATAAGFGQVLPPIEEKFQRHDGTTFIAEVSAIRIHFDGKPGHLVLFRDLSDRKETERRQKLASTVFNVAANAIVITDSANNIL
ncbi:MAG: PAS domain S-box protein, partial [Alphaproteobacteria bacterium]|nr:PAS domain S-box protein [Alphaproteobacteria bacterium]